MTGCHGLGQGRPYERTISSDLRFTSDPHRSTSSRSTSTSTEASRNTASTSTKRRDVPPISADNFLNLERKFLTYLRTPLDTTHSAVKDVQLTHLRKQGYLYYTAGQEEALAAKGEQYIKGYQQYRSDVSNFVVMKNEASCRTVIDPLIVAAIAEVNRLQSEAPIQIKQLGPARDTKTADRIILAEDYDIGGVEFGMMGAGDGSANLVASGTLDYAVLLVNKQIYPSAKRKVKAVPEDPYNTYDLEAWAALEKCSVEDVVAKLAKFRKVALSPVEVSFSAVKDVHLVGLRKTGILRFKEGTQELSARGDKLLEPYERYRRDLKECVYARNEAGCRMLIDPILQGAVKEASRLQALDPVLVKGRPTEKSDRVVIAPEYDFGKVSLSPVGEEAGRSVSVGGPLDYAVLLVSQSTYEQMTLGLEIVDLPKSSNLLLVMEVKGPTTVKAAIAQVEAQVLAALKFTGRGFFPGIITNGIQWWFYLACANKKETIIYSSEAILISQSGLITATLLELIRNPGSLPTIFRATINDEEISVL
ncbi:hypothetical protein MNV49_000439 [Pseudohyphozyma bogoriensis]|nr:hypothetical protein MNV49_000439 [Pseudohyphozyma bogoriensis]